ncbi:MAG: hypothetical protein IJ295_00445, partial [Clostridia bacterium]|nr:hypothetical protein [Clostridia bacterium]
MNWGNSLLWVLDDVYLLIQELFYNLGVLIVSTLYNIWRLLAWVVGQIEKIFRNLAGLGSSGNDMVSEIIEHKRVEAIFGNLVGLATALIIFFTIVKIIQDHYKDKEGGNPYKIVIRTFKGLLMFFFVNAAVTVGIYASGVMFRALDAATGGGTESIAGQVFKTMAYDANRMRIGSQKGLGAAIPNKYWERIANKTADQDDGKYVVVEMTGNPNGSMSTADIRMKQLELFPEYKYGIVGSDGVTVTPLAEWMQDVDLSTEAIEDNPFSQQYWNNYYEGNFNESNGIKDTFTEDGSVSGTFGYKNDLLKSIRTNIRPNISLAYSPIDIMEYYYEIRMINTVQHDVSVPLVFTTLTIPMSTAFVAYERTGESLKSMEDSAKQFGITFDGKVALQDGKLSANFDFDSFTSDDWEPVAQLMLSVLSNVLYTNLVQQIIEIMPKVPGETAVSGVTINYIQLIAPLMMDVVKSISNNAMDEIIPRNEKGENMVEPFVTGSTSHNAGIWVNVNEKSKNLAMTIQKYRIDDNFDDLWGQLIDSFEDIKEQMSKGIKDTWKMTLERIGDLNLTASQVEKQREWLAYQGFLEQYNKEATSLLQSLGNDLYLYEELSNYFSNGSSSLEDRNNWLEQHGYTGSYEDLEGSIKTNFVSLVSKYNIIKDNKLRPSLSYADPRVVPGLYQPIIEFKHITDNKASEMAVGEILETLSNNKYVTVNMAFDTVNAYRMIDWNAYGPEYEKYFNQYIDLYISNYDSENVTEENQNEPIVINENINSLVYTLIPSQSSNTNKGLAYFISSSAPFKSQIMEGGFTKDFCSTGYWGNRGITVDEIRYFQFYSGFLGMPSSINHGFANDSSEITTNAIDTQVNA